MQTDYTDVVLFFEDHKISKQMLLAEFEAVLDHVVSIPEFQGQNAHGAYIRVNSYLDVRSVVLFKLGFDDNGASDPKWNLPLDHLAGNSAAGPDLGGGKIRLACFSQCPIAWHQKQLWDPVMTPANNTFVQIRDAIAENKLGLEHQPKLSQQARQAAQSAGYGRRQGDQNLAARQGDERDRRSEDPPALSMDQVVAGPQRAAPKKAGPQNAGAQQDRRRRGGKDRRASVNAQRDRIARLIKSQRLHIATLKNQREEDAARMKAGFQKQLQKYDKHTLELEAKLRDESDRCARYKNLLEEQADNARLERERFSSQLREARSSDNQGQLEQLQQKYELEMQARLESETAELKEMLEMRNVELFYREEQMTTLRDEIAHLRQEKVRLLSQGANTYLDQLNEAGVDFVAHHPGAGHISIPAADIGRYLDSPMAYAAAKCYVTEELYTQWLEHYQDPVCQAMVSVDGEEGMPCGRQLERVDIPNQFVATFSNRCIDHQQLSSFVEPDASNDNNNQPEALRRGA